MPANISLSVFFPCYNEAAAIESLTIKTRDVLRQIAGDWEIIIVDDCSSDGTAEIADRLSTADPRIKVIHHSRNMGYGAALQSGFRNAAKEWVFYTDGDAQFDIRQLAELIPYTGRYDIVSGFRIDRKDNVVRKINGWTWSLLINFFFNLWLKDIDCAFKLYKRVVFDKITMNSRGALIDTEILVRARQAGFTITQHGVRHFHRQAGNSSGGNLSVIVTAFRELYRFKQEMTKERKQHKKDCKEGFEKSDRLSNKTRDETLKSR